MMSNPATSNEATLSAEDPTHDWPPQDFLAQAFDQGDETIDLFRGFDIPFWLGDDQYAGFTTNWP